MMMEVDLLVSDIYFVVLSRPLYTFSHMFSFLSTSINSINELAGLELFPGTGR